MDFSNDYRFLNRPVLVRAQKGYKINKSDPMDVYTEHEFFRRFRFTKKIFSNILMPMIFPEEEHNVQKDMRE